MASLFIDQYDIEIEPDGFFKEVADGCQAFQKEIYPIQKELKQIWDAIDQNYTCEHVYSALGTGTAVGLFASLFPGKVVEGSGTRQWERCIMYRRSSAYTVF